MKQRSRMQHEAAAGGSKPERVVGLNLGDRYSHYCMLTDMGELMEEGKIQSTAAAMQKQFGNKPRVRIALEAGTHSPWVSRQLRREGHEVIVANPRVRYYPASRRTSVDDERRAIQLSPSLPSRTTR